MCCNVWGLGALNVYWAVIGILMTVLNILPFSLDCSAGMESWMGVTEYECTSLEAFLNYMWCFVVAMGFSVAAFMALMPKIKPSYPSDVNKLVMLFLSVVSLVNTAATMYITSTTELHFGDQVIKNPPIMVGTFGVMTVLLLVAMVVHKEPDGRKLLF
jgi:hypothetical protein